jgi:hypothetical protein
MPGVSIAHRHMSRQVSPRQVRMAVRRNGHLITEALLLAAPAREMDGDVCGNLDRLRQDLHDPAKYLLLLRGRDGLVGLRGRRARMRGGRCPGSRCGVSLQALLRWCCHRPRLDAARPAEQVNDAVVVAGGTLSVPLLCGLDVGGPARGQSPGVPVVPGGERVRRGRRTGCRGGRLRRCGFRTGGGRRRAARKEGDQDHEHGAYRRFADSAG